MVFRINRVYTRSGDDGSTSLVGGKRVRKSDRRVCCYGEVDELNSLLGCLKEESLAELGACAKEFHDLIEHIQQELFDLGSELATPPESFYEGMWRASATHVERLERLCDQYGDGLPELTSFILPGGSPLAAQLHVARCVSRRVERALAVLQETEPDGYNVETLRYMNRLSDLLFILARWTLKTVGKNAPLWVQEKDRLLSKV